MKIEYLGFFVSFLLFLSAPVVRAEFLFVPQPDSLIKGQASTIYYYASDGYRYVFPNEKAFDSWFSDFVNVITISNEELGKIPLKGNVTYRPGVRMVKIQSVPKVYAVDKGGKLRWIKTEELAKKLYGDDWNKKIDDIPDPFFVNYQEGDPIENETAYNATTVAEEVKTINKDRGITESALAPKATSKVGDLTIPAIPVFPDQPTSSATSTIPLAPPGPFASNTSTPFAFPTSTTSTIPAIPAIPATPALPAQPASLATSSPFVLPTSATSSPAIPAVPAIPATPAVPAQPISSITSTPPVTPAPSATTTPSVISAGRIVVLTPNGGEQLITGSTFNIQWTNPLVGGFAGDKNMGLSLNVYRTGDGVWAIGTTLPTTQTSYQWTIPSSMPVASNYYARVCLVKYCVYSDTICPEPIAILPNHISMPSGACAGDESDGTFTISAPVATSTPADTTPPSISSVGTTNITETGATINWTTNETSDSSVQYGTTQSYGQTSQNTSLATSHVLNLTGLSANTTYHYQVKSKDSNGNQATSGDYTFTTPLPVILGCNSVDFEDDSQVGSNITGNSSHVSWLNSKGLEITATPGGYLHTTRISGEAGISGIIVGFASPNFSEQDEGISDEELLTIKLLNGTVKTVNVTFGVSPLPTQNNLPATVEMNVFNTGGGGVWLGGTTKTFTGVTNGVYTPSTIGISMSDALIDKITLKATQYPYGGVYIEKVEFGASCSIASAPSKKKQNNFRMLVLSIAFLTSLTLIAWRLKAKKA